MTPAQTDLLTRPEAARMLGIRRDRLPTLIAYECLDFQPARPPYPSRPGVTRASVIRCLMARRA